MSLTKDDLQAIKKIIDIAVDGAEDFKLPVGAGFAEVHEKFTGVYGEFPGFRGEFTALHQKIDSVVTEIHEVNDKVDVKDGKLENTVQRVDDHGGRITKLERMAA
ncbi:MAG: hypothetical protein ACR2FM_04670 [Candidatus Saccharimonadales bacterium]